VRHRALRELGVLLGASAAARLLGMAYRVLLARAIGSEGLGLYQMAFPVFLVALTLASLGLPVGVAQLVAAAAARGDSEAALAVRRRAAWLAGSAAVLAAAALQGAAPRIAADFLLEPRAAGALALLAWALPPTALAGVYRGYWQGLRRMDRVGLGHVCEAGSRCAALVCLALALPSLGGPGAGLAPEQGIALAAALVLLGEVADLAAVVVTPRRRRPPPEPQIAPGPTAPRPTRPSAPPTAAGLLRLSLPVAVSRASASLGLAADAALIPAGLAAHAGAGGAAALFGQLTGMALPVVAFPTVALHPIDTIVVPAVSQAAAVGDRRGVALRAGASALAAGGLAAATSLALTLFSRPIAERLYGFPDLAALLRWCAAIPPGLFLAQTGTSVLNGLGRTGTALVCQLSGTAVRLALLLALVPALGLPGAVTAIAVGAATTGAAAWGAVLARLLSSPAPV
jgi:stage V sporulation protein B